MFLFDFCVNKSLQFGWVIFLRTQKSIIKKIFHQLNIQFIMYIEFEKSMYSLWNDVTSLLHKRTNCEPHGIVETELIDKDLKKGKDGKES